MPLPTPTPPTFATPLDGAIGTVAAPHVGGSPNLTVDSGTKFGNPSPAAPVRITALSEASGGRVHYLATARTGNTLTVAPADGYPDIDLDIGDTLAVTCNKGMIGDIHAAILAGVADLAQVVETLNTNTTGFVFNQTTPSDTWVIDHGLGRFPSITVVDSAGSIVVGSVVYTTADRITVSFSGGFSGTAYLN